MGVYEEIVAIRKRVEDLERIEQPARSGGLPVYPSLTAGSVIFAGTGGVLAQDNTNLYWDDSTDSLGIGINTPTARVHAKRTDGNYHFKSETASLVHGWGTTGTTWRLDDVTNATRRLTLDVNGVFYVSDVIRAEGYSAPAAGSGLELGYTGGSAYVTGFNRTGGTYLPLVLRGSTVTLQYSGTTGLQLDGSGNVVPGAAGTQNLGTAALYWNDVSYKTITDRGCLALIDKWEMPDGRKLSNLQVLRELRAHETDKTIYGETKLDYDYVPKHSKKTAPIAEEDTELDVIGPDGKKLKFKKGEKMGSDGVEMTSMFSVMIGAIRELAGQVEKLQAKQK